MLNAQWNPWLLLHRIVVLKLFSPTENMGKRGISQVNQVAWQLQQGGVWAFSSGGLGFYVLSFSSYVLSAYSALGRANGVTDHSPPPTKIFLSPGAVWAKMLITTWRKISWSPSCINLQDAKWHSIWQFILHGFILSFNYDFNLI